ncbi:hypothetical protein bplSymb_SCF11402P001 [Bathymodiolus platifrons methanotrophic gill symbiont]|uniref:hypothetical protein n=1 Tax=Bathymodiolus platifrons methanotrophic gill symbiont TaxID=113268 RepID=UPI000B408628|nr:hypothetical protein [Bathymodiolus platifrons methanotrophic gill symbiont]GAW87598.1 hypothetical protein bplSymb_SCF11402P001 [Bathymodiolus platifrons methanotrophic gill symbiont]GFO74324.1 hypothetical protein BPLS_P0951 [Bathymodiolus platifrons methanotrophic gill symbiont]
MKLNKKILAGGLLLIAPIQKSFALSTLGWIVLIQSVAAGFVMTTLGTGVVLSVMLAKIVEDASDFEGLSSYNDWQIETSSSNAVARTMYDRLKHHPAFNAQRLKAGKARNDRMIQAFNDTGHATYAMYLRSVETEKEIGLAREVMDAVKSEVMTESDRVFKHEDRADALIALTEGAEGKLADNGDSVKALARSVKTAKQGFMNIADFDLPPYLEYTGKDGELVLRYCPLTGTMTWRGC